MTYLAEQVNLHRQVCIKEFFPKGYYKRDSDTKTLTLSSDSFGDTMNKFKVKFIKEAQTIVALDHYNIVHIFDVFEENNTVYYVMEYINGDTLSNVVKINGTLTEEEAVNYIRQIASALEYIHERHIMHLDVKPGNVMLRKGNDHAILIDFGLSKHYDEQSGEATTSTPIGVSHGYAPAEQYQMGGIRRFSPETDIYSLGATLYYLVIGSIPPSASELESMDIPDLPETLSEGVRRAIRGAMKYLRKDRPQSIKEFLALLDNDQTIIAVVPNDNKTHITSDRGIEQEDTKYEERANRNSVDSENERKPDSNALGQQINYDKGSKHENKRAVTPAAKPTTSGPTQSKPTQKQKKRRGGCIVWLLLIFIIAFLAFFISKQYAEAPSTNVPGNSTENQMSPMATTLILDTHNINAGNQGESGSIAYTIENPIDGCELSIEYADNIDWIKTNLGEGVINYEVEANPNNEPRKCDLVVIYGEITQIINVTQTALSEEERPKPQFILTSESDVILSPYGETKYITYTLSNPIEGERIELDKGGATWFDATETNGKIAITAKANNSGKTLSSTLNVKYDNDSFSVVVKQNAKPKFTLTSESNITLNPYGETKYITYTLSSPIEGRRIELDKGGATWFNATETSGKIAITAKANNSGKTLSATLKVSYGDESFSVNVKQNAISRPSSGTTEGHGWVDLGLSVKWATCNVGSKSPKELGDSYAWGDTRWRISFDEHNKSYSRGDYDISGSVNNDVARKEWGGSWRMPTIEEWEELISKCEWTPVSGGYNVTGPNGGSIFLPFTGRSKVNSTYVERNISCGEYWSSTPCPGSEKAYSIDIGSSNRKATDRYKGCTVRPVTD